MASDIPNDMSNGSAAGSANSSDADARARAIERLHAKAAFQRHLMWYLLVNAMLWVIWALVPGAKGDSAFPWPLWSMLGWGFAVASQYQKLHQSGLSEAAIQAEMLRQAGR